MRLGAVVLDSNDADKLSSFYQKLLGWTKTSQSFEGETWYILTDETGKNIPLLFQDDLFYEKPKWPSVKGTQHQMLHLDFYVTMEDYSEKVNHALSCGAVLLEPQPSESWKVFLDPSGHPFCIIPVPAK